MNTLRNKVQLIGNIGKEPMIYTTETGKKVARFSLATVESYKDGYSSRVRTATWVLKGFSKTQLNKLTHQRLREMES
jgi:single-stranded DNA-binding protein